MAVVGFRAGSGPAPGDNVLCVFFLALRTAGVAAASFISGLEIDLPGATRKALTVYSATYVAASVAIKGINGVFDVRQ